MEYRCPVCGFTTDSDAILARHMATTVTMSEYHFEWMETKGVPAEEYSPFRSPKEQRDFFDNLREVVARECRTGKSLATA